MRKLMTVLLALSVIFSIVAIDFGQEKRLRGDDFASSESTRKAQSLLLENKDFSKSEKENSKAEGNESSKLENGNSKSQEKRDVELEKGSSKNEKGNLEQGNENSKLENGNSKNEKGNSKKEMESSKCESANSSPQEKSASLKEKSGSLQVLENYQGVIHHFFTHALIAYPNLAFSSGNQMSSHYEDDCLTAEEFKKIIKSFYDNDFVLVDISKIYDGKSETKKQLMLPKGKKPLILSFDDIVYDGRKKGLGMVDRIAVKNGKVVAETDLSVGKKISTDNEFLPILESFIESHPDFSFENARGIICLTGFQGVLGYRTQSGSEKRQKETDKAKEVISHIKNLGWKFACHSYGHGHMKRMSLEKFQADTRKWQEEVAPLVGKTDLYVYPFGEWEMENEGVLSKKQEYLHERGFRMFFGVGVSPFFSKLPYSGEKKFLFMDRCPMDGLTLRLHGDKLKEIFNAREIYSSGRRKEFD